MEVASGEKQWVSDTVKYVRNQTNHYGGKYGWQELIWAMDQLAETEGEIEIRNSKLVGMRFKFADSVANQHLARKWPEYAQDANTVLDETTVVTRLKTLMVTVRDVVIAAQNFVVAAIQCYLDTLPETDVRIEGLTFPGDCRGFGDI